MKGERLHEGLELPRDVLPPMVVTETIRHNPWYTVTAGCFFINGRGWMERRFLLSIWKNVKTIFFNHGAVSSVFAWHLGSVGHGLSIRRWWIKLVERIVSDKLYLEWWKKNCYTHIYIYVSISMIAWSFCKIHFPSGRKEIDGVVSSIQ